MTAPTHQHPRFGFRNAYTGEPPTIAEWRQMEERAREILGPTL